MNTWKITKPLPGQKTRHKRRKQGVIYCNCGKPAVARAKVLVGFDCQYTVTLNLCAVCLAYDTETGDVPPPLNISFLD